MNQERKKPIRLEWQGGIAESTATDTATRIVIKGSEASSQNSAPKSPTTNALKANSKGPERVRMRRETKGRGGHPVLILHDIEPKQTPEMLKSFATILKTKLGCGGTAEDGEIILQTQNADAIEKKLALMGVTCKRCGGF
jgi:translation initiation factor 1